MTVSHPEAVMKRGSRRRYSKAEQATIIAGYSAWTGTQGDLRDDALPLVVGQRAGKGDNRCAGDA